MLSMLDTAVEAAAAAGDVLRKRWRRPRQVRVKGLRDIVTDADLAAQRTIADIVRTRYPDHAFVGEEGDAHVDLQSATPTWIVDPLDGTTNYARNIPTFSVAIAVAQAGQVLAGVIHDPLRGEMFYAERGQGAYLQRARRGAHPARVSACAELSEAVVGLDWARDPHIRNEVLSALTRVAAACRTVRAMGSAALGLAWVAAGRLDAYYHLSLQPWDVAAGALLIVEAGGALTRPGGQAWELAQPRVAASNGPVHAAFVGALGLDDAQADRRLG
jgi:myo-inositol-1(or 4)-monophosphatase